MIYILLLEESKLYVGFSERMIGERVIEHFRGQGSKWTKRYRPVQVLQVQPGGIEEENEMTLKMMDQYGWWNVRGGSWTKVDINCCPPALLKWQGLKSPLPLRKNECFRCGRNTHFVKNCFAKTTLYGQSIVPESGSSLSKKGACYRCKRITHFVRDCYAKTDINGVSW